MAYDEEQAARAAELIGRERTAEDELQEADLYEALMREAPGITSLYEDEDFEGLSIIEPPQLP